MELDRWLVSSGRALGMGKPTPVQRLQAVDCPWTPSPPQEVHFRKPP